MNKSIESGIEHEQEHRKSLESVIKDKDLVNHIIKNIAMDHLRDDPDYYEKLDRMEHSNNEQKKSLLQ